MKTKVVDALFPYQMLWFLISSPTQREKMGKDWNKVASEPSGTGPFKLARLGPRERAELVKNEAYWNPKRIPKADRMVLIVAPEASTCTAALLSGAADLTETPPPDAVDRLAKGGMKIVQNVTPHVWNYHPSMLPGSPWTNIRLRKAANLAIDRNADVQLLGGLAQPAVTAHERGHSGDVQGRLHRPRIQGGRTRGALHGLARQRQGRHEQGRLRHNIAYVTSGPLYAFTRFFASNQAAPVGVNWSCYANPEADRLIDQTLATFDPVQQDALLAKVHEKVVVDAVLIWVVHDTNPHALSPKIKSYIQAQHWFQDLTMIGV